MTIGEFIRLKRKQAGLSQQVVADCLGFSHRSRISRKELGEFEWKWSQVVKFSELINMSLTEFVKEFEDNNT